MLYIRGISETIARKLQPYYIRVARKPIITLRRLLIFLLRRSGYVHCFKYVIQTLNILLEANGCCIFWVKIKLGKGRRLITIEGAVEGCEGEEVDEESVGIENKVDQ